MKQGQEADPEQSTGTRLRNQRKGVGCKRANHGRKPGGADHQVERKIGEDPIRHGHGGLKKPKLGTVRCLDPDEGLHTDSAHAVQNGVERPRIHGQGCGKTGSRFVIDAVGI